MIVHDKRVGEYERILRQAIPRCTCCKTKLVYVIRFINDIQTSNSTGLCPNEKCTMFINIDKVKVWKQI